MGFDLVDATTSFAQDLQDLLDAVLRYPSSVADERRKLKVFPLDTRRVIRFGTREEPGVTPVHYEGRRVGNLEIQFYCEPDQDNRFLAVRWSRFQLESTQEGTPLLRLDYDHNSHTVPAAHWNIHAERGATSVLLARCNRKHDGLVSKIHFPVGGTRYRPCLEDFLEMLITEFNVDRQERWKEAVHAGREKWRTTQTRAIVRDSPDVAADVLRSKGYTVEDPPDGAPQQNRAVLRAR